MTLLSNPSFVDHLTTSVRFVLPEVTLVGAACVLFTLAAFRCSRVVSLVLGLIGVVAAGAVAIVFPEQINALNPAYAPIDPTGAAMFIRWIALISAAVYLLLGWAESHADSPEYNACLLVVAAGVSLVGRANDLVLLFLALEMISIPTYVLLYLPSRSKAGQEAAMKYFMLSVLSSGVLLFGFSYLYGLTGSTNLPVIISTLTAATKTGSVSPLAMVGMILVIAGLGFRIAMVPFHFYAPDVYEGGPTGVVAQLAFLPKVAGFVALGRIMGVLSTHGSGGLPFDTEHTLIPLTLWVIAVVTMTFGNLLALIQDNLRRLFAYSGIAHGGYMLIGVLVACSSPPAGADQSGMDSVLFYLVAYGLMTVGAFGVITHLTTRERAIEVVDDLAGMGKTNPFAALLMSIFFLSLIGLPLTVGFVGKLNLVLGAFQVPSDTKMKNLYQVLAAIAVLNAAVSAVYYLRVIGVLFLRTPLQPGESRTRHPLPLIAATVCAAATLVFGVYPQPLSDWTHLAAPVKSAPALPK